MFNVRNKKMINRIAFKNLMAARARNIIAVSAVILTTVLFTSIFSMVFSVNASFQQETFRQVGGYSHASFKDIDYNKVQELTDDKDIKRAGLRHFLGLADNPVFKDRQVEVSYMDDNEADFYFCTPGKGRLPDGKNNGESSQAGESALPEFAADTYVLDCLGIEPEIGAEAEISYMLDNGEKISGRFRLSGWWEYDSASQASMVIVSEEYCNSVLKGYKASYPGDSTGKWTIDILFNNSFDIEGKAGRLLERHNYQLSDPEKDNYISVGINWGYSSTQILNNYDFFEAAGLVLVLLMVIFAGYLVIYNIFRISVSNDIHFYGLLKTIGATRRQIRRIVFMQAAMLSLAGMPAGLIAGYLAGNVFTKIIVSAMDYSHTEISTEPLIFVISVFFTLVTLFLSCFRPARLAGKASPVEALGYTEAYSGRKKKKKGFNGTKIFNMAVSNTGRKKGKTAMVVASLVLCAVILDFTITLAHGFDMDKYTSKFYVTDFLVGKNEYLDLREFYIADSSVGNDVIQEIEKHDGIQGSGCVYGTSETICGWYTKDKINKFYKGLGWYDKELMDYIFSDERDGLYGPVIQLYGMDKFALGLLDVIEGDVYKTEDKKGNYIIEVISADDYGKPVKETEMHEINDQVELTYGDEYFYYDKRTGKEIDENTPEKYIKRKKLKQKDITYTICAKVIVPESISYRYYSGKQYILGTEAFKRDTGTDVIMEYLADVEDSSEKELAGFLEDYTTNVDVTLGYESRESYQEGFEQYRDMFVAVGGALASVVGLIGVLNFFNTLFTEANARKHEFAVMQAVGMTGAQLKKMLVYEGLIYTLMAVIISVILCVLSGHVFIKMISGVFWFFTGKLVLLPLFVLALFYGFIGIVIPLVLYPSVAKKSVTERLRTY